MRVIQLARRTRTSDMRNLVTFYEHKSVWNPQSARYDQSWVPVFDRYCMVTTIYREQLKTELGGASILRDRREFTTRYDPKVTHRLRCKYNGEMYEISIVGDTRGDMKEIRFLGEAVIDGGA